MAEGEGRGQRLRAEDRGRALGRGDHTDFYFAVLVRGLYDFLSTLESFVVGPE
jgi:hypothetical protein